MAAQSETRSRLRPRDRAAAPLQLDGFSSSSLSPVTRVEHGRFATELLRDLYLGSAGDLAMALVLLEVASRSFEAEYPPWISPSRWPRPTRESLGRSDDVRLPQRLLACNVLSLSEVVGMPRETVRRKTAKLVDLGWIESAASGGYVVTRSGWCAVEALAHVGAGGALMTAERIDAVEQARTEI